ncbi:ABC transporter ATP-binding protein [Carboxylicivirga marina]|uniref:ABC transporter ATP-binding protein n=1 Tax=Carboxylicivirga marina TaxID=2800988 RepID=A0ABS1HHJ0_9BACT|nr:ABC transporter ATP-binding protein [Carboxylicivirga marina]MBK3517122.1 ABC transporter ATP-binding protein [Carboxylicivirga marina]
MSILKLSNIHKSYADGNNRLNAVLKGLNLEVEEGDFISVKGPSGSGKTTLLSILGTLLPPDEGQYLLNGEDLTSTNADLYKIRNKLIGFVFQDHRLLPQYSALENILLPVLAYQSSVPQSFIDYAHYLMEMTQIEHVANQLPESLSGGESSRVAVCRALIMKPSVLLADEPTGQLDMENAQNIVSLLSEVNKVLNTTVIMVTHSDDMAKAAKRIVTLKNGILQ